ncbi:triose-phosphate isomerase [Novosphingopyxis iocasae]|uniref:triose-phosphate isomerase n=1 Tax=Novosphingopyxis iocasae TaxID=2762729 RepID=UPI001651304E|nr:triose-phosphate isomerase [Novosphingopyxis iocasae]
MAERRKFIAGNWKMHGLGSSVSEIGPIAAAADALDGVDVALCVPATLIHRAAKAAPTLSIGAQDCHQEDAGAHTGCISAAMLAEVGASLTIVGHSERRQDQHESDADIKAKAEAARAAGLSVILCCGETEAERDAGQAVSRVTDQIAASMPDGAAADWLTIAYEPIWAIGTGRVPGTDDVAEMHSAIRAKLRDLIGDEAEGIRILYGGSMNGGNAAELLAVGDVDGGLVGGASLSADKFVPIIEAAAKAS